MQPFGSRFVFLPVGVPDLLLDPVLLDNFGVVDGMFAVGGMLSRALLPLDEVGHLVFELVLGQ